MVESIILQLQVWTEAYPWLFFVIVGIGSLNILAGGWVALTPNKKDDQIYKKLQDLPVLGIALKVAERFSPLKRNDKRIKRKVKVKKSEIAS